MRAINCKPHDVSADPNIKKVRVDFGTVCGIFENIKFLLLKAIARCHARNDPNYAHLTIVPNRARIVVQ